MSPASAAEVTGDIAMRGFSESLPMALLQAREATMALFRPLLAEHDLTEQQWRVLRALTAAPDPLEVGAIADATFLLGPSLSRILRDLEARGLVSRSPAEHDQRRVETSLTNTGRELVALIAPRSEATYNRIEEAFGDRALRDLLDRLADLRHSASRIVPAPGAGTIATSATVGTGEVNGSDSIGEARADADFP